MQAILSHFLTVVNSVDIVFCKCSRSLNSHMAHLLSRKNEYDICLFGRLSSNVTGGPNSSENDLYLCM